MLKIQNLCLLVPVTLGCLLTACKTAQSPAVAPQAPAPVVMSNKNEPVIFNGKKFLVSFDYKPEGAAYNVAVRRAESPLRDKEADRKDAEQVAKSTLTHYACPNSTKAQRVDEQVSISKNGEWRSWLRCT